MDTRELTPGDRRELRSLVKKQFEVLRKDVKRREAELTAEVESELLERYRQQDTRIEEARVELAKAADDYERAKRTVLTALREAEPNLEIGLYNRGLMAEDPRRAQLRRAVTSRIPQTISDAMNQLDQAELALLRDLTVGALDSDQAKGFLNAIPTVGQLVPAARLEQLLAGEDNA